MNLNQIRINIDSQKSVKAHIVQELLKLNNQFGQKEKDLDYSIQAQQIIQIVAKKTQESLESHISEIVSTALNSIFDDDFELKIKYETKRNQTEVEFYLIKNGNILDLRNEGGGVLEIASFALRMACWKLKNPKCNNFIIADEPFKSINDPSRELHRKTAEMIKYLSRELNLQIILISLIPEIEEIADKIIKVEMGKDGISKVN